MINSVTVADLERRFDQMTISCVFIGRSVIAGNQRFVVIRDSAGKAVATGKGSTIADALQDALSLETPRKMPGM
jgi:hypothetical protein